MSKDKEDNNSKLKLIGAITVGGLILYGGYRLYQRFNEKNGGQTSSSTDASKLIQAGFSSSSGTPSSSTSNAFVSAGSKGAYVQQLQIALIHKYGYDVLPKYGADGVWGNETQNALTANGHSTSFSRSAFDALIQQLDSSVTLSTLGLAATQLAKDLWAATTSGDFDVVRTGLARMKNVSDYTAVSSVYKGKYGKTLVTGLFNRFGSSYSQRNLLETEFKRMGLKYDGSKWSLSGLGRIPRQVRTRVATEVWGDNNVRLTIPQGTVLGYEIQTRGGITMIKGSEGQTLNANRNHLQYV